MPCVARAMQTNALLKPTVKLIFPLKDIIIMVVAYAFMNQQTCRALASEVDKIPSKEMSS